MNKGAGTDQAMRYLDGDAERHALIADIYKVRQEVIEFAEDVPQAQWYVPRYHGWSLAAMLTHLYLMDHLALIQIKLALLGFPLSVSSATLDRFNDLTSHLFQRRVVATTTQSMLKHQRKIDDFILRLPMDQFTKSIYYPPTGQKMTVEHAIQQYFLFHWRDHLQTLRGEDNIYYEPPTSGIDMM